MTDMKALDQKALEAALYAMDPAFFVAAKESAPLTYERAASKMTAAISAYIAVAEAVEPVAWDLIDAQGVFATTHVKQVADDNLARGYKVVPLFASALLAALSPEGQSE